MFVVETVEADSAQFGRVSDIRRRVYGEEFGFPSGTWADEIDTYSTHLICTGHGVDVGVLRMTFGSRGRLELEAQNEPWRAAVAGAKEQYGSVLELTRFMVVPQVRGGIAYLHLVRAALQLFLSRNCGFGFLAGKDGPLSRLYQSLGAQVHDQQLREYRIGELLLGHYKLLGFDRAAAEEAVVRRTNRCT